VGRANSERSEFAPFWEGVGPDKKIKEWGAVCELLRSMHARGDYRYKLPIESVDDDPPDCVIQDSGGVRVGVEVTEFVDQEVIEMCERAQNEREQSVYREWTAEAVREKVAEILKSKDAKAQRWRGLYGKAILVIYTDEIVLQSPELFPMLDAGGFPRPQNIAEAYFICSYEPTPTLSDNEKPYPYTRLRFERDHVVGVRLR